MSLPPVPPRPNSPQKLVTCILQSEHTLKKAKDTSYDNLKDTELQYFSQKQFSDELSNDYNKHILAEQMNHLKKDSVINASSYNTHENINIHFPSNISESNSQKELIFQKSNSILVPTDSNTEKQYTYICNKNHEKHYGKLYSKPENKTCISFSNSNNNYQLNSLEKNTIITNKETKEHNGEKLSYFSDSFSIPKDIYSPNFFSKNSTITYQSKDIKDSNYIRETELSKTIIYDNAKNESHSSKNNSDMFQKYQKTRESLEFRNFKTSEAHLKNTLALNDTNLNCREHFFNNKTYEQDNNISFEDITEKNSTLSNFINNNASKIEKCSKFMQKIDSSNQIKESENENNQSANSEIKNKPTLPLRPIKKEFTSNMLYSSHASFSNIKNSINTRAQFSRDLEEKLKFGSPRISNLTHLQTNTNKNDTFNSLVETNKPLLKSSMLEDLRKTRSKGPSRRKPTAIITEFSEKLKLSSIVKLFDIIKDETSEHYAENNIIKPIIKNNPNASSIKDFIEDDKPVMVTSSNNLLNTFSAITLN
ncbi:hypothetical protein PMAC_001360 [Pneumocystis sp. 'macacae']|nr:hypothetical protein PMAC_001360 [Pneumocystis sp. 'macacae']